MGCRLRSAPLLGMLRSLPPEGHDSSLEVEVWICVACDPLIAFCADNLLDLLVDEVVEGVNVLLDESAHLQSVSEFLNNATAFTAQVSPPGSLHKCNFQT